MIHLNYNGTKIEFPSEYTEITIRQMDRINSIFENKEPELIQWVEIVSYLSGLPIEEVEEWDLKDFMGIIAQMFIRLPIQDKRYILKIGDRIFEAPKKAKLSVRQTAKIEKALEDKEGKRFAYILDTLLKERVSEDGVALTQEERIELFSDSPAKLFMTTIMKFGIQYVGNITDNVNLIRKVHEIKTTA